MGAYNKVLTLQLVAAVANGYALSQTPGAAGLLNLNGSLVTAGIGSADVARRVAVTTTGDESAKTFTITGTDRNSRPQVEVLTGPNTGVAYTQKDFLTISSVRISAAAANALTVGTNGVASTAPFVCDRFIAPAHYAFLKEFAAGNQSILEASPTDLAPYWDLTISNPSWMTVTDAVDPNVAHGPFTMMRLTTTGGTGLSKITINTPFNGGRA